MTAGKPHDNWTWRKARNHRIRLAKLNDEPCYRCGQPIDYRLSGRHPDGPTADHITPLAEGGPLTPHPEDLAASHNRCNSRHGAKLGGLIAAANRRNTRQPPISDTPTNPNAVPAGDRALNGLQTAVEGARSAEQALSYVGHHPGRPEASDGVPAVFPDPHPSAVGSRGDSWIPWIEEHRGPLRWWQRAVLARGLEVDASGEFCWRQLVVTTPRQVGKSVLLSGLALARIHHAQDLGEEQLVLHLSMNLTNAGSVMSKHWLWAHENGYRVTRSKEQQAITLPSGDQWRIVAAKSAFGFSAGCVLVDEAWELEPKEVVSGVVPTLAARSHAQMWLFSTANNTSTDLVPGLIRAAGGDVAVFGWWGSPDDDPEDEGAWRRASPFHDDRRAVSVKMMLKSGAQQEVRSEFLNLWPDLVVSRRRRWLDAAGWAAGEVAALPPQPAASCGVVEVEREGGAASWMRGWMSGGRLHVEGGRSQSLQDAVGEIGADVAVLLVGLSARPMIEQTRIQVEGYGMKETALGSQLFARAVREGRVVHAADGWLDGQVESAVARQRGEFGEVLDPRGSHGDVTGVKMMVWLWHRFHRRDRPVAVERAAIY